MDDEDGWIPYPRFLGKPILIRDRTGKEYTGILRFWKLDYIKLETQEDEILISRKDGNIVSLQSPRLKESPRSANPNQKPQEKR